MGRQTIKLLCLLWFFGAASAASVYAQDCAAEITFTNPKTTMGSSDVLSLNLFSTAGCLPGSIHLSATFLDADENFICSGVIEGITDQTKSVQSTNIDIRPLNMQEFVRLRAPKRPLPKRLFCMNIEGNVEVNVTEIAAASFLRLRATVVAKGAVRTTETRVALAPR